MTTVDMNTGVKLRLELDDTGLSFFYDEEEEEDGRDPFWFRIDPEGVEKLRSAISETTYCASCVLPGVVDGAHLVVDLYVPSGCVRMYSAQFSFIVPLQDLREVLFPNEKGI